MNGRVGCDHGMYLPGDCLNCECGHQVNCGHSVDAEACGDCRACLRTKLAMARQALIAAQGLADGVNQGPRSGPGEEWRIPWTPVAVETFALIANALSVLEDKQ